MNAEELAGQLLVVGYPGVQPPVELAQRLALGHRAGVVLFKRNIPEDLLQLPELIAKLAPSDSSYPALVAVDQEGGRVMRIRAMALPVPAAAKVAARGAEFVERVAYAQSLELRALGFTMNFAPVLDVHTEPSNPVIGDRAFGTTPEEVVQLAGAWARGMRRADMLSCGKHFPGHGDTTVDSHLALPRVPHAFERLSDVELLPFTALCEQVDALMSAHVVYEGWDPGVPATLSYNICTFMLRKGLGFHGVLFSDDLEMKALSGDIEGNAIRAVLAGCDQLLICSNEEWAERAHAALIREVETSDAFRARVEVAVARSLMMRRRVAPHPNLAQFRHLVSEHEALTKELS